MRRDSTGKGSFGGAPWCHSVPGLLVLPLVSRGSASLGLWLVPWPAVARFAQADGLDTTIVLLELRCSEALVALV